jgi:hypothetical protein
MSARQDKGGEPDDDWGYDPEAAVEQLIRRYSEHLALKGTSAAIPFDLRIELFSILDMCVEMDEPLPSTAIPLIAAFLGVDRDGIELRVAFGNRDMRGAKTKTPHAKAKARMLDAEYIKAHGYRMDGRPLAAKVGVAESTLRAWRAMPGWPGGAREK